MTRFKEVKEFDIITYDEKYKGNNVDKYQYLEKERFLELTNFIHEFNAKEENSDVLDFMKIEYRRDIGDIIRIKNYVGLIELKSGFQIQILPKISLGDEKKETIHRKTKKILIEMLKSMKRFPNKIFTSANLNVDKMNLYEIFINMYIQEVRNLINKGMKSSYIEKQENIPYFKGKLLFNKHIKENIFHKERFFMQFDEYQMNRPENKIIKSTLLKLQKMSSSVENVKQIKQILVNFELVEPSTNYVKDFSKVVIDRNTKDYELLMKWSKVFLSNKSFTTFSGTHSSRALLFSMERLFEGYIAKYVKKVFQEFNVVIQDRSCYLFDEPRKQFALKPDLIITNKEDGSRIIMDTKWKILDRNKRNYGISQADMYQMYAYAKKCKSSEIYLLYPKSEKILENEHIQFISEEENDEKIYVNVFFVDLDQANIEDSMKTLLKMCRYKSIKN